MASRRSASSRRCDFRADICGACWIAWTRPHGFPKRTARSRGSRWLIAGGGMRPGEFAYIETIEVLPDMRGRGSVTNCCAALKGRRERKARARSGCTWNRRMPGRSGCMRRTDMCAREERQLLCEWARRPDLPQGAGSARVSGCGLSGSSEINGWVIEFLVEYM